MRNKKTGKKTIIISCRFSDQQLAKLQQAAQLAGLSPAEFMRRCSLHTAWRRLKGKGQRVLQERKYVVQEQVVFRSTEAWPAPQIVNLEASTA